jgi:DNA end-binding protein Ku
MRGKDMVALGRVVMSKREYVMMLEPFKKGLRATTLRYPNEVRDESAYFDEIPDLNIPAEMRQLAEHILESKRTDFDPSKFEDRYETALTDLLRRKQAGMPAIETKTAAAPSNVVNLMDALRRSIAQERKAEPKAAKTAPAKKGKKRVEGQREMLLPISVKGAAKDEIEKKPARNSGRQRKAG